MTSIPPPRDGAPSDQPPADDAPAPHELPAWPDPGQSREAPPVWPDPAQSPAPSRGAPALWPELTQPPAPPAGPPSSLAEPEAPRQGTPTAPAPTGAVTWKPWSALLALLLWFGVTLVLTVFIGLASAAMGYELDDPPPGVNIAGTFAQDLAMIGAVLLFAYMAGRPRASDLGLVRTSIGKAVGAMISVWIAFVVFSLAWKAAISLDDPQTLPDQLGIEGSTLNLALVVVIITVLAPVSEEILFRGYIFRALRNWRGVAPAAIITGLIFGAVHIGSSPVGYALPLAAFGFGLCLLYQWTGSLYPCIALHALNNALALGIDQGWGWEIGVVMIGAVVASLTLASMLGRAVERRAGPAAGPVPEPAA